MASFYISSHSEGFLGPLSDGKLPSDIPQITIKTARNGQYQIENLVLSKSNDSGNNRTPGE